MVTLAIITFFVVFSIVFLLGYLIYFKGPAKGREAPIEESAKPEEEIPEEEVFKPTAEDIRVFVGKNADYYLHRWELIEKTGLTRSWNWSAFLFTWIWMVYRKMYLYAFIAFVMDLYAFIVIAFVKDLFVQYLPLIGQYHWIIRMLLGLFGNFLFFILNLSGLYLSWIIRVLIGFFGNFLYYIHTVEEIAASKSAPLPENLLIHVWRHNRRVQKKRIAESREPVLDVESRLAMKGGTSEITPAAIEASYAVPIALLLLLISLYIGGILTSLFFGPDIPSLAFFFYIMFSLVIIFPVLCVAAYQLHKALNKAVAGTDKRLSHKATPYIILAVVILIVLILLVAVIFQSMGIQM